MISNVSKDRQCLQGNLKLYCHILILQILEKQICSRLHHINTNKTTKKNIPTLLIIITIDVISLHTARCP